MAKADHSMHSAMLSKEQMAAYEESGFVHSIPILSADEVRFYRAEVETTRKAIGGRIARLDSLHLYFRWAWDLSTHPRLLACLEELIGPDLVLKSTRIIYKHGGSAAYVGWHQDGITEGLEDGRAPAVWLTLTDATVENGCLRVVPGSHRLGLLPHDSSPDLKPLPGRATPAVENWHRAHGDELSQRITSHSPNSDSGFDLVMRPGEMSIHHPVVLHGSNANRSTGPRIALSASYSTPELYHGSRPVVWAQGDSPRNGYRFEIIDQPPAASFEAAITAYCAADNRILFATA
jgi:ectoine hydroxylase-related dioxygenase (phytanoyl-CoA dioxygenase family)